MNSEIRSVLHTAHEAGVGVELGLTSGKTYDLTRISDLELGPTGGVVRGPDEDWNAITSVAAEHIVAIRVLGTSDTD